MPYVTEAYIDDKMRTLLTGTHSQRLAMLRTCPITPPDGATGMALKKLKDNLGKETIDPRTKIWSKWKIDKVADMVGFLKLLPATAAEFVGATTFIVKTARQLPNAGDRVGWVPCWFLPWKSGQIFKLKITNVETTPNLVFGEGIDPMPNPDLFFTAGINGCSVFAVGDPKFPSMYHGGLTPGCSLDMPLLPDEFTEAAWERLLGRVSKPAKQITSVGKTDYISQMKDGATANNERGVGTNKFTTRKADEFEKLLMTNGALTNIQVNPWGAVFGLREASGRWQMTLVRNATVVYKRLVTTKTKRFLRKTVKTSTPTGEMLLQLRAGADGMIDYDASEENVRREMPISTGINLGYLDFFPARGVAHFEDLGGINIF